MCSYCNSLKCEYKTVSLKNSEQIYLKACKEHIHIVQMCGYKTVCLTDYLQVPHLNCVH